MQTKYITLPSLTIGSGLAALLVAIHHASETFGAFAWAGNLGWIGVTCFFILSGFVLAWSNNPDRSLPEFYLERLAKLYPLHALGLLISVVSFFIFHNPLAGYVGSKWSIFASLLLVHDWIPGNPNTRQAWNGVSWAVSAEFFFCLLAPFMIAGLARISSRRLIDIAAALYLIHLTVGLFAFHKNIPWLLDFMQYNPIARIPEFIYGIIFSIFIQRGSRLRLPLLTSLLVFLPLLLYYRVSRDSLNPILMIDLAVPAFIALTVYFAINDLKPKTLQSDTEMFKKIGHSSYALYITHALLLGAMSYAINALNLNLNPASSVCLFLISSVLLSVFVTQYVERPARKLVLALRSRIIKKQIIPE